MNNASHTVEPLICIEQLSVKYGESVALQEVSFGVARGNKTAIIGPNGSGKSTLMGVLSGLIQPHSGHVAINGMNILHASTEVKKNVGVVFQDSSLDLALTTKENLLLHGRFFGMRGKMLSQQVDTVLAQLSIEKHSNDRVETLSGGMKRRVELAKAMLHQPSILLLDEPTVGLDLDSSMDFWNTLTYLQREQQVTILVSTHAMHELQSCDSVVILSEGRLVTIDTPFELQKALGALQVSITGTQALSMLIKEQFGSKAIWRRDRWVLPELDIKAVPSLIDGLDGELAGVQIARPTMEDVFMHHIQSKPHQD